MKQEYDYNSQISTLPTTNSIREETRFQDERKAVMDSKQKYDYTSSIHNLPGYRNDRVDDRSPLKKPKEELGRRFVLTSDETLELKLDKQASPNLKVSYKNGLSQSDQDVKFCELNNRKTNKQINPHSKPMKQTEGHANLLVQSKDEYFCIRVYQMS